MNKYAVLWKEKPTKGNLSIFFGRFKGENGGIHQGKNPQNIKEAIDIAVTMGEDNTNY